MRSDNVSMLQKVFGYTDFDAVEFSRWSETAEGRRKQVQYVRALLPENVQKRIAEIDAEVMTVKEKRKDANAEVKTYTTICAAAEKQLKTGRRQNVCRENRHCRFNGGTKRERPVD